MLSPDILVNAITAVGMAVILIALACGRSIARDLRGLTDDLGAIRDDLNRRSEP